MGVSREDGFFSEGHSESTRVNGSKLPQEKFILDFRKEFHNDSRQGLKQCPRFSRDSFLPSS